MLKLKVRDMACGHCVAAVEEAVKSADPAAHVQVDLSEKTVTVGTQEPERKISDAIRSAGYHNERLSA